MKVKSIPSSWISRDGFRLDCNPYMTGALEARIRLDELSCPKERLEHLCDGGISGLVNAGRITRQWVEDATYGVPFLTSTSILQADLSKLRFISKQAVRQNPKLLIRKGYTLITRAGSIGRMAYARPDMDGMACTEDVLRVIPDREKVPPGYLYAFLSSRFGVPLVTSGTYGAIIQHIEPEHIAGLPVPRLGDGVEDDACHLVELASRNRSEAARLLKQAIGLVRQMLGTVKEEFLIGIPLAVVKSSSLQARFDAFYYSPICHEARRSFDNASGCEHRLLSEVAEVFIPGIFKRRYAEGPSHGVPYITGGDVFQITASSDKFLVKRVANEHVLQVRQGTILVQEAGQLGGLIGRSVFVGAHLDGFAVSNNMVRITSRNPLDAGYIYVLFSTTQGVTLLSREAAGSSIPHMDAGRLSAISIPWPPEEFRHMISEIVNNATDLQDKASKAEGEARSLVELAIEEAP
jgi:type I restriction enzyme S subunit